MNHLLRHALFFRFALLYLCCLALVGCGSTSQTLRDVTVPVPAMACPSAVVTVVETVLAHPADPVPALLEQAEGVSPAIVTCAVLGARRALATRLKEDDREEIRQALETVTKLVSQLPKPES